MNQPGPSGSNGPPQKSTPPTNPPIRVVQANLFTAPKIAQIITPTTSFNQPSTSSQTYQQAQGQHVSQPRAQHSYIPNVNSLKLVGTVDLQGAPLSDTMTQNQQRKPSLIVGPQGNVPHLTISRNQISMAPQKQNSPTVHFLPPNRNNVPNGQTTQFTSSIMPRPPIVSSSQLGKMPVKRIQVRQTNQIMSGVGGLQSSHMLTSIESGKQPNNGNGIVSEGENVQKRVEATSKEANLEPSTSQQGNKKIVVLHDNGKQQPNQFQRYQYGQAIRPGQTVVFVKGQQKSNFNVKYPNAPSLVPIRYVADPLLYRNGPNSGPVVLANQKLPSKPSTSRVLIQDITPSQQSSNSVHFITLSDGRKQGVQLVQMATPIATASSSSSSTTESVDNISNSSTSSGRSSIDNQKTGEITSSHSEPPIDIVHSREPSICSNKSEGELIPKRRPRVCIPAGQQIVNSLLTNTPLKPKPRRSTKNPKRMIPNPNFVHTNLDIFNPNQQLKSEFERIQREKREALLKTTQEASSEGQASKSNTAEEKEDSLTTVPFCSSISTTHSENTSPYKSSQMVMKKPVVRVAKAFASPSELKQSVSIADSTNSDPPTIGLVTPEVEDKEKQNILDTNCEPVPEADPEPETLEESKKNEIQQIGCISLKISEKADVPKERKRKLKRPIHPSRNEKVRIIDPPSNIDKLIEKQTRIPIDVSKFVIETTSRSISSSFEYSQSVGNFEIHELAANKNPLEEKERKAEALLNITEPVKQPKRKRRNVRKDASPSQRLALEDFEAMIASGALVRFKETGRLGFFKKELKKEAITKKKRIIKKVIEVKPISPAKPPITRGSRRRQQEAERKAIESPNKYATERRFEKDSEIRSTQYEVQTNQSISEEDQKETLVLPDQILPKEELTEENYDEPGVNIQQADKLWAKEEIGEAIHALHNFEESDTETGDEREDNFETHETEAEIDDKSQSPILDESPLDATENVNMDSSKSDTDKSCEAEKLRISRKYASCLPDELPGGFPSKRLSLWTTEESASWFVAVTGKEELRNAFIEEEIDGNTLSISLHNDLIQIFNLRYGPGKKLEMALAAMKEYEIFLSHM